MKRARSFVYCGGCPRLVRRKIHDLLWKEVLSELKEVTFFIRVFLLSATHQIRKNSMRKATSWTVHSPELFLLWYERVGRLIDHDGRMIWGIRTTIAECGGR